jgi:hypothetical protein
MTRIQLTPGCLENYNCSLCSWRVHISHLGTLKITTVLFVHDVYPFHTWVPWKSKWRVPISHFGTFKITTVLFVHDVYPFHTWVPWKLHCSLCSWRVLISHLGTLKITPVLFVHGVYPFHTWVPWKLHLFSLFMKCTHFTPGYLENYTCSLCSWRVPISHLGTLKMKMTCTHFTLGYLENYNCSLCAWRVPISLLGTLRITTVLFVHEVYSFHTWVPWKLHLFSLFMTCTNFTPGYLEN